MFNLFKKSVKGISSIDDLINERSKTLVRTYELDFNSIYPLCTEINAEISKHHQHLLFTISPDEYERKIEEYQKKLAAAATLSYELSVKESVQFSTPSSRQVKDVPKKVIKLLASVDWKATRLGSPSNYQFMGRIFDKALELVPYNARQRGVIEVDIYALDENVKNPIFT